MKNLSIIYILLISVSFSQKSTKKWNEYLQRYDITLSDGTKCYEKYNKYLERWESNCPN